MEQDGEAFCVSEQGASMKETSLDGVREKVRIESGDSQVLCVRVCLTAVGCGYTDR